METFQLFPGRSDKHISHEQCMVGSRADDSDADPVSLIPSSESVDDVNAVSCVQIIDCTLAIDTPDLEALVSFAIRELLSGT